jgi:hypothetical protein
MYVKTYADLRLVAKNLKRSNAFVSKGINRNESTIWHAEVEQWNAPINLR